MLRYSLDNIQGVGARNRQEDSFAVANAFDPERIETQGLFFSICDGMGGMKDGKLASQTAVAVLRNSFLSMNINGDIATQLKNHVYAASSEIERLIGGDGGSTVVEGIIFDDSLYYASVGDSYFYILRNDRLTRLNREQNLCHENYRDEIRRGSVDPSDYQDRSEAGALTSFLGMSGLEDVDCSVRPLPLCAGDILIACTDGVGGILNERDIKNALSSSSLQESCRWMENRIGEYNMPNQDNYTAIIIKCE